MFKGKRVFVFGAGIGGLGAAKVLVRERALITLYDEKKIIISDKDDGCLLTGGVVLSTVTPAEDFCRSFDFFVLSHGVPITHPLVNKAREAGLEIIDGIRLTAQLASDSGETFAIA